MKKRAIKIIFATVLFVVAILIDFTKIESISNIIHFDAIYINNTIFILAYLIVGLDIVKKAIRNIFRGKVFDENFLMTVATIGAFAIGEFPEACAVMLFYQVGELFQSFAVDKSRKSISNLMDIRPDYANKLSGEKEEKVDPDDIKIGDIILIKPGEKVPLDGIIIEGNSMLDTKALTGESVPRNVDIGNEILSGCINQNGLLKVKVTKEFDDSTVNKILELVENASNKKSKSENFITKFAKYYTPTVVVIATILAIVPPIISGNFVQNFSSWLYRALSFLVVSCPCALVISIPLSFFGGIGGASRKGVLIKGGNYLEALSNAEIVVFDKTGTLTKGVFEVQDIKPVEISKEDLLKYAAHSEKYSNHPIAESIKKEYKNEIDTKLISNTEEIAGHGMKCVVEGKNILIGNDKLMEKNNIDYIPSRDIGTVLYVAINGKYVGSITIADKIKEDSKKTIELLKKSGIKVTMLTGDKNKVGSDIAKLLNIDDVHTELLPDEKVSKVEELLKNKSKKGKLIFVGDGINDAPVLAISDIGIAMGTLGSDAAIEAADIVLMTDEPSKIGEVIKLARKTMRIVRENIVFAIFVKVAVLILSAIGLATMWEAVFADVGVSVIAIINALRVLKK